MLARSLCMTTTLQRQHLHEDPLVDPAPALETHIVTVTITLPPIEKDTASDDSTAEPSKDTTVASPRKMQFQIDRMSKTSEAGVLPLLIEDSESGKSMVLRVPTIPQPSRNIPMSHPMIRFKHSLLSWQIVKSLEPPVQRLVLDSIPGIDGPQIFCLAALVMNGYGIEPDAQVALKHVAHAAYHDEPNAQAYLYRLSIACGIPIPPFFPLVQFLKDHAQLGSRMALQDLSDVDPVIAAEVRHRSRSGYGGVGADWYFPGNMFHDYTQPKLAKLNFLLAQASTAEDVYQLKINRRGDSLLHFAASSGFKDSVVALIQDLGVDVNFVNECGETALLCACRAAHYGIIDFLLNNDANPSMQAKNGESALHWLISLDDTRGIAVGQRLLDAGADVDSMLLQRVTHSTFKAALDIDILRNGTPLTWAVQCHRSDIVKLLLSNGASPLKQSQLWQGGKQYALGLAAYFHRAECLKIMLTALEERELSSGSSREYLVSPLLELAVGSADKFSMILRNSTKYKEQLHMTLALLIEQHSRYISPSNSTSWGAGHCYRAVKAGHWDVVEFFLSNRWQADQINQPYGKPQRTCLLESVRFNRRSIFMSLVEHGADPLAKASNPFNTELRNWTALHIFAEAAHDTDLTLVTKLIELGVPVDGRETDDYNTDTPFCISVCNDSFNLANKLLSLGANPNAVQTQSSIVAPLYPMTPLGRIIITNARFSSNRLNYLLFQCGSVEPAFIVEPKRQLSALHRVSMAYRDVLTISGTPIKPEDFDMETNREIAREILKKFSGKEHLNLKCGIEGKTALHLAVQTRNIGVVRELLDAGADRSIKDDGGITPAQLALELTGKQVDMRDIVRLLTRVDV
ncbi:hypothetical protein V502_07640 [Pseudogymnoascus sp. VKM F-4520 (FW-2644)]|nr:hypothetical protein V502_07640 [Pseudogymnoascus sp. VKM F-4520 (FW-2644)]